ncbi:MAG: mechanosensitive ion channel, partial [Lachnospiraceae bacterium]|nr:mechanosensitive ion channel [Lachnospiraceae bacterium]
MGDFFARLGANIEANVLAFFNAIPGVLAAILWLLIAFGIATVVKNLVIKMLKALKVDKYLTKWGVTTETKNSAIDFVGKLVYFVIFLLFLPVALGKLGLSSVASPIVSVVDSFLRIVPNLVAASVVLVVGLFIAKLVKDLLIPILKALKIDALQQKAGVQASEATSFSVVLANIVYAVIVLVVISAALSMLGIAAIYAPANQIVTAIFKAIPLIICAILIIAIGVF